MSVAFSGCTGYTKMEENAIENDKKIFIWKRKRVTEVIYNLRIKQVNSGLKRRKAEISNTAEENDFHETVEGRRLVDIPTLAKNLSCEFCKELLSLNDIVFEKRVGLASLFTAQCRKCLFNTPVPFHFQWTLEYWKSIASWLWNVPCPSSDIWISRDFHVNATLPLWERFSADCDTFSFSLFIFSTTSFLIVLKKFSIIYYTLMPNIY